jgi:hypothetical protein
LVFVSEPFDNQKILELFLGKGGTILNAEKKFLDLRMGNMGFQQFTQRLEQSVRDARELNSKYPESNIVLAYLEALKCSELARGVLTYLDNTDDPGFPKTFEEAQSRCIRFL